VIQLCSSLLVLRCVDCGHYVLKSNCSVGIAQSSYSICVIGNY